MELLSFSEDGVVKLTAMEKHKGRESLYGALQAPSEARRYGTQSFNQSDRITPHRS
jgi:hypothetical protein